MELRFTKEKKLCTLPKTKKLRNYYLVWKVFIALEIRFTLEKLWYYEKTGSI